MDTYVALLEHYHTRDKILRIVSFAAGFASGAFKGKLAKDLVTLASSISSARTVNRLFDDVLMWKLTKTWGANEKDVISRRLTSFANLAMQLYYPTEKIAWAADNKIIPLKSKLWWGAGIVAWGIYLVLNILRSVHQVTVIRYKIIKVLQQRKLASPDKSGDEDAEFVAQLRELRSCQRKELLSLAKNLADLIMCVNWLPVSGFLWSGRLSVARNSFFGTLSSLIGLYMSIENCHAGKKTNR